MGSILCLRFCLLDREWLEYAISSVYFADLRAAFGSFGRALGSAESRAISCQCCSGQIRFRQVNCAGRTNRPLWISIPVWPLPTLLSPASRISPYSQSYYVPPAVVATAPYFCVLHNEGYVSRVGLLDHLAGTHKIPLDAAVSLCPDGTMACIFPSY